MKKILLIFTTLVLSSCAILMGTSMHPIILGKMLIYVRTSTAKAFIATEMPEKLEIDTPFYVSGRFDYRNAIHDTTKGIASVTLDNRDLEMGFRLASYSKASQNNPEVFQKRFIEDNQNFFCLRRFLPKFYKRKPCRCRL